MMVMWGTDDTVIPYHAVLTHTAIPHSELVTFSGSGHFPFHDDPERFTRTSSTSSSTPPLDFDPLMWRELMSSGGAQRADLEGDEETIDEVLRARGRTQRHLTTSTASATPVVLVQVVTYRAP